MYRLFTNLPRRGKAFSTKFHIPEYKYEAAVNRLPTYYEDYGFYVKPSNLLVRLVAGLVIDDPNEDDLTTYLKIKSNVLIYSRTVGMTDSSNIGRLHADFLYTGKCAVLATSVNMSPDFDDWEKLRPVRVLTHPHVNTEWVLPNMLNSVEESDYSVVGVDIPLLAVMYKNWRKVNGYYEDGFIPNDSAFIAQYIFPRMFKEQIEIACRNRLLEAVGENRLNEPRISAPIRSVPFGDDVTDSYVTLLKELNTASRTIGELVTSIPVIGRKTYAEAVPHIESYRGDYSYWVHLLVYTDWLYCVVRTADNFNANQDDTYRIAMTIHRWVRSNRPYEKIRDRAVIEEWKRKYNYVMDKLLGDFKDRQIN